MTTKTIRVGDVVRVPQDGHRFGAGELRLRVTAHAPPRPDLRPDGTAGRPGFGWGDLAKVTAVETQRPADEP